MDLRGDVAQHAEVVAVLVVPRHDQCAAADLVDRVFELASTIGRVDVDEDQADPRGRELRDEPLVPVGGPDAHPIAAPQAEREQAGRKLVGLAFHVVPRQAQAFRVEDRSVARAMPRHRLVELLRDGDEAKRLVGGPRHVRQRAVRLQAFVAAALDPVRTKRIRRHALPCVRSCASRRAARRRARRGRGSTRRSARRPVACPPGAPPRGHKERSCRGAR